jgi:hypothetical protein
MRNAIAGHSPRRDDNAKHRVVRYENLIDELAEIFTRLNVPFEGNLGVRKEVQSPNRSHTVSVGI